jgi:hypothetical protein
MIHLQQRKTRQNIEVECQPEVVNVRVSFLLLVVLCSAFCVFGVCVCSVSRFVGPHGTLAA